MGLHTEVCRPPVSMAMRFGSIFPKTCRGRRRNDEVWKNACDALDVRCGHRRGMKLVAPWQRSAGHAKPSVVRIDMVGSGATLRGSFEAHAEAYRCVTEAGQAKWHDDECDRNLAGDIKPPFPRYAVHMLLRSATNRAQRDSLLPYTVYRPLSLTLL